MLQGAKCLSKFAWLIVLHVEGIGWGRGGGGENFFAESGSLGLLCYLFIYFYLSCVFAVQM